jgi:hypothetical protein
MASFMVTTVGGDEAPSSTIRAPVFSNSISSATVTPASVMRGTE